MFKLHIGPLRFQMVRGERMALAGVRVVPVATVLSLTSRKGFVGPDRIGAHGFRFVRVQPVALLEERQGVRRVLILADWSRLIVLGLLASAVATWLATRSLSRRLREAGNG